MRAAIRDYDWASGPLGPSASWPETLRTVLALVLDTAFPMLIMWGPELIQLYNDGYIAIFGDKHPQSLGQPARGCWADIWSDVGPLLLGVYDNGEAVFFENLPLMMQRHGRYEEAYFTFSYSPIREMEDVRGIICVVSETTAHILREREAAERAAALAEIDRTKTEFFNNVSHEFRTPLTLMLGPLEDALRTVVDRDQRRNIELARQNALRLLKLVNTLLEFARAQAGRSEAAYAPTDLGTFTSDLCALFRSAIENGGLAFAVDVSITEPVYVDTAMWETIVFNLLSNALKFTIEGGITVLLRERDGAAELVVSDTGTGIAQEELPQLFQRFHQARSAKSRSHEGSGIGLSLVKELVHLHGGSISVQSAKGHGTEFTVRIPLGTAHLDEAKIAPAEARFSFSAAEQYLAEVRATLDHSDSMLTRATNDDTVRARILFVDDNRDLREYVASVLAPTYDIVLADNGVQALTQLQAGPFDLVLSDVMMPEMDGLELVRRIRTDERLASTPIILLSARAGEESTIAGLDRGANDYLRKPFSSEELRARVRAQLEAAIREGRLSQNLAFQRWFDAPSDDRTNAIAFRTFADLLPIMVYQQDVTGAVSFVNSAWHDITQLPRHPSSFTLEAWKQVVHPDDLASVIDHMSAAIAQRSSYAFEYRLRPARGDESMYRWYIARGETQYDGSEFKGWISSVVDVHDARVREMAERELHEAAAKGEREFKALAEAIPVIVWTANADGFVDYYNDRWYEYTGQNPQEAAGWGWQGAHHPEDLPAVMQTWPHSIATGDQFEMEFRLRRHDGVFHTFLARARPLRDGEGAIVRWYGSNVDIDAQKQALDRSQRVAETLQAIFLPKELPHTKKLRVDAIYQAAEKDALIGGDWYDGIELPDGRIVLSIGDVTGHGLDASVIAGRLRQAIVDFSFEHNDPAQVLERVNRVLRYQQADVYATALVCFIDVDATTLTYASAGHPSPILARTPDAPATMLPHGGIPLGVEEQPTFHSTNIPISKDCVVAFYTDGITEFARDVNEAEGKLMACLARLVGDTTLRSPAAIVRDAVLGSEPAVDDVALMVVQFSEVRNEALVSQNIPQEKTWRFHSSDAHSARMSRLELTRFIRHFASDPDAIFAAELVLGEILANTVEHAPGLVEVHIDWSGNNPVVNVRDTGPGLDHLGSSLPNDPYSEDGRGLFLISALATDVCVTRTRGFGTELRVVLPLVKAGPAASAGVDAHQSA